MTSIALEERRLRRIFAAATLGALSTGALACGSDASAREETTPADASVDADPGDAPVDSPLDARADAASDVADAACAPQVFQPEPADPCGAYVRLPCGLPPDVEVQAYCFLSFDDCQAICPGPFFDCHAAVASCTDAGQLVANPSSGFVELDCDVCGNGVGRAPEGLVRAGRRTFPSAIGAHFAAMSRLEAASVVAFRRFRRELASHGAPAELVAAAARSARDEIRHARTTGWLARRFGAEPLAPSVRAVARRSFEAFAIDNAVEGCVRETFGALVARFGAERAADAEVATALDAIADDETLHAALSWAVFAWCRTTLDAHGRAALAEACERAIAELRAAAEPDRTVRTLAGVPDASERKALIAALERTVWSRLG